MYFLPGCSCCDCQPPCPDLLHDCLSLTFDGFANEGTCNECNYLDDGTYILERKGTGPFSLTGRIEATQGSGAVVALTVERDTEDGSYTISDLTLTSSGSGYSSDAHFAYTAKNGSVACNGEPVVTVVAGNTKPEFTATLAGNHGGELVVSVAPLSTEVGDETWQVSGITVTAAGSGYADGAAVTLTDSRATVVAAAAATISVARSQPSLSAYRFSYSESNFQEASVSLTTESFTYSDKTWWRVASTSINYQYGTYEVGDLFSVSASSGTITGLAAVLRVSAVSESGEITEITIDNPGRYYATDGSIASVTISAPGEYYRENGITATLVSGGKFFANNACVYSWQGCSTCPEPWHGGQPLLQIILEAGSASHTLTVQKQTGYYYGRPVFTNIIRATATNTMEMPIEFPPESFDSELRCQTTGTATIEPSRCDAESHMYCELPESIALQTSGIPVIYSEGSWNYLSAYVTEHNSDPEGLASECGVAAPQHYVNLFSANNNQIGVTISSDAYIVSDVSVVLDHVPGCPGMYIGPLPPLPYRYRFLGTDANTRQEYTECARPIGDVQVQFSLVSAATNIYIAPPTRPGSQAYAEVTAVTDGAVSAIAVTDNGSAYAVEIIDRDEPTVTAAANAPSGGTNCTLSVALTKGQDSNGEDVWYVSGVDVTAPGSGYTSDLYVTFTAGGGDVVESQAYAVARVGRTEPTVTASASSGTGASFSVTITEGVDNDGNACWQVSSVSVTNGGSGYTDGSAIAFSVTDGIESGGAASGTILTGRVEPEVTASVQSSGTGAVLAVALGLSGSAWGVSGVTVTDGGVGYSEYDTVLFVTDDTEQAAAYAVVSGADEDGAITAVTVYSSGAYYRANGTIESVSVDFGGGYYKSTGSITSVVLSGYEFGTGGGAYYHPTPTGFADVDVPQVTIGSNVGDGSTATAVVDGTVGSPTFGQVTGVTVTNGGQNYKTAGNAWAVTIIGMFPGANLGFIHSDRFRSICPDTEEWEPFSNRTSTDPCVTPLLNREYKMGLAYQSYYEHLIFDYPINLIPNVLIPQSTTLRHCTTSSGNLIRTVIYGASEPMTFALSIP